MQTGGRKCMWAGVRLGLQILRVLLWWTGRFDSDSLPPNIQDFTTIWLAGENPNRFVPRRKSSAARDCWSARPHLVGGKKIRNSNHRNIGNANSTGKRNCCSSSPLLLIYLYYIISKQKVTLGGSVNFSFALKQIPHIKRIFKGLT